MQDFLFDLPELRHPSNGGDVLPFSVLRADTGNWQTRKRAWTELGLRSDRGREHVGLFDPKGEFGTRMKAVAANVSVFDPVLAELSYTWYCPPAGRILDPFAGGSVRGLVAATLGYHYTGVDLSARQIDANRKQAHEWAERGLVAGSVEWVHGDAAEVLPTLPDGFDYVFTCPPYHNLERYSDHPADLSAMRWPDFENAYRTIVAASVNKLADNRFTTWVVSEIRGSNGFLRGLVPLTLDAHRAAGARPYNDAVLVNVIGSMAMRLAGQWNPARKMGRHHQYVLTFVNGDAKAATMDVRAAK